MKFTTLLRNSGSFSSIGETTGKTEKTQAKQFLVSEAHDFPTVYTGVSRQRHLALDGLN
jgi:hypothetical protein